MHWHAAGGAIYGIELRDEGTFMVFIIDDAPLRMDVSAHGSPLAELSNGRITGPTSVAFEGEVAISFDETKKSLLHWELALRGDVLHSDRRETVPGLGPGPNDRIQHQRSAGGAPHLEAADLAFSADTGKRGIDGWMDAFASNGTMLRKNTSISGDEIREEMMPVLSGGGGTLAWAPLASGVDEDIKLGYTVGTATFTGKTTADSWRSSYVTIWEKQHDATWKVRFDTGRPITD